MLGKDKMQGYTMDADTGILYKITRYGSSNKYRASVWLSNEQALILGLSPKQKDELMLKQLQYIEKKYLPNYRLVGTVEYW